MANPDVFSPHQLEELKADFNRADKHARWTAKKFYGLSSEKGADLRRAQTDFQLACKVREALAARLIELGVDPLQLL